MFLSIAKAEYRATTMVAQENTWIMQLKKNLYQPISNAMELYSKYQSAIHRAKNQVCHARAKHVEVYCQFVIENVLEGEIDSKHVNIDEQVADILMKGLGASKFEEL